MQTPRLLIPKKLDKDMPITAENLRTCPAEIKNAESPENSSFTPEHVSHGIFLPKCLSINEAAKITNLSYEYLRYLCYSGKVNHLRCGKRYMIDSESLAKFIRSGGADK